MFAGAGSLHRQSPVDEPLHKSFGGSNLPGIGHVDHRLAMKFAVPDMADDRADKATCCDIVLRLDDAFGQPRDRDAHVGRHHLRPGPGDRAAQ